MQVIIDEDILYANDLFANIANVKMINGRLITRSLLITADALIIRSITIVNENLLKNTNIKFVGSVTSGYDHVDTEWLKKNDIFFAYAPGDNAIAVVEYIFSALLLYAEYNNFDLRNKVVGIVGVGNIGSCLNFYLQTWGVNTLLCDPPLENNKDRSNKKKIFVQLDKLISSADILSFNVSLNKTKKYSTFHLLNQNLIHMIPDKHLIINTSRGSVIDNQALLLLLKSGKLLNIILDVWEYEPNFSLSLLQKTMIGTPHIAGYSIEGKIRSIITIFNEFNKFFGISEKSKITDLLCSPNFTEITFRGILDQNNLNRLIRFIYDIRNDDYLFKKMACIPGCFDKLRKYYPIRHEWSSIIVNCNNYETVKKLNLMGFNAKLI